MIKTYHIAKVEKSNGLNFILGKEKVSETAFFDLLHFKLKEITGEKKEEYDRLLKEITDLLERKKTVTLIDRSFEIKFKKSK